MPTLRSPPLLFLLGVVAVPLAALAALVSWVFGLKAKLSASEVATYLRDFIGDGGGAWDWDDFTSVPKRSTARGHSSQGCGYDLPVTDEGSAILRDISEELSYRAQARRSFIRGESYAPIPPDQLCVDHWLRMSPGHPPDNDGGEGWIRTSVRR